MIWTRLASRARRHLTPHPCSRSPSALSLLTFKCSASTASAAGEGADAGPGADFEPVFSLPHIGMVSIFNRMKLYTTAGASLSVPGCAALASLGLVDPDLVMVAVYIGVSSTALLSIVSILTRNIIGFLYVSKDNQYVKISFVDYWGRRQDKIVLVSDWTPLSELPSRSTDFMYLLPKLESNKIHMKLIVRMGRTLNSKKMGELLE